MEITLTITFNPQTSQISVDGPVNEIILCYGILDRAKDAIKDAFEAAGKPRLMPINGLIKPL